jgi:hypothetical protein
MTDGQEGWREELKQRHAPWFDDTMWSCRDGWRTIIEDLTAEIAKITGGPEACQDFRVVQVKQKLGGLRFYTRDAPGDLRRAISLAIDQAEELSFKTCERCGRPGRLVDSGGCLHTACHEHEEPESWRNG